MKILASLFVPMLILASVNAKADADSGSRITLSAAAQVEVANDEVAILYQIEAQGFDVDVLRKRVNRIAQSLQKRLQAEPGLTLKTTSRQMEPVWEYPKNAPRQRNGWRLVQSESAVSNDLSKVGDWVDSIEKAGAQMTNLEFRVSRQTRAAAEEDLRLQAIASFRLKAGSIAAGLDASSFRIVRLNTNSQSPRSQSYGRELAAKSRLSDSPPPALSAGTGFLQVTVQGEIETPLQEYPVD